MDAYGDSLPAGAVARLGSVRWRYANPPEHLTWSPDGKYLLGTRGNELTIWAYPDGVAVGRFVVPEVVQDWRVKPVPWYPAAEINPDQIRFEPDGRSALVYAGENQLFRVSLPDGRSERLETSADRGRALGVSADGRRLLVETPIRRSADSRWTEVRVIDRDRRERALVMYRQAESATGMLFWQGNRPPVIDRYKVRLAPDGRLLVIGFAQAATSRLAVIDVASGQAEVLPGESFGEVLTPSVPGSLFTVSSRTEVTRWEYAPRSVGNRPRFGRSATYQVTDAADAIDRIALSPDGTRVVVLGQLQRDGGDGYCRTATVLDGRSLRVRRTFDIPWGGHERRLPPEPTQKDRQRAVPRPALTVAPDGRTLALASYDSSRMRFFSLTTGEAVRPQAGHATAVTALRATASGRMLVSLGADRAAFSWELPTHPRRPTTPARLGRRAVALGNMGYDDLPPPVRPRVPPRIKVIYDRFRNQLEGRLVDSETLVWEAAVSGYARRLEVERPAVLPTAEDRDRSMVAVPVGGAISIRDPETGEVLMTLPSPGSEPTAVEFLPEADLLAAGYADGQVLLWDLWPADLPRTPPTEADWDRIWSDLAGDPRAVRRARLVLLAHPNEALAGLTRRVRALPRPTALEIDQWMARLSHPRYAVRELATRLLVRHFDVTEGPVREYLAFTKNPEVEHRLRVVLDSQTGIGRDAEVLRLLQIVGVLERIGTPAAREVLAKVAAGGGLPASRATAALDRLRDRAVADRPNPDRPLAEVR